VQVIGRVAVHHANAESARLTGSGQRLLAVLVAAGPEGATAERIAEEIWGASQPNPWRPALRMAVARLRKQLPQNWDVISEGGTYRVETNNGWVDAWRLEELAVARSHVLEEHLAWMLAGQPFGDVDLLEMVASSTQNLQMLQITVAELFCAQAPSSVTTKTCTALTSLLREHPYNDRLAVVVAQALEAAGRRTEALLAITSFADAYSSEFGAVPTDVASFLSNGRQPGSREGATDLAPSAIEPRVIAKELRHLTGFRLLGRVDELARLRSSAGAFVTGVTGSGKSRLLAALIEADSATETVYVVGDDRMDLPLGPFAVAMPAVRDELLGSVDHRAVPWRSEHSSERTWATQAWRIVLAYLEARSTHRPQRLIVDDAHLLDQTSLGLLRLLIRSNTAAAVTFVVCGPSDSDDAEWVDLARDAERAGLQLVELGGLGLAELELMVYDQFPQATRQARMGLARDVYEASDGLPAVAAPLITAADPETLALPEQLSGASALTRVTASLSASAPEVVAAAAVLGHQFSIGELIALTGLDEASIFRVLDELWSSGLIVETDDPDQVKFRHVLLQRALLENVPRFRRGQLHRRASEFSMDAHRRADHYANAGALVPADTVAASLLVSAELYARCRQWRKVARELRRVNDLGGDYLDPPALSLWAAALDQSGADGSVYRQLAYGHAMSAELWEQALDAALSGLPEAELPDGDPERISMLEGIPSSLLPASRRFDRVFHLSRQYSLTGDHIQVLRYAEEALEIASDPEEVGLSHVLRWIATRHVEPVAHSIPDEVVFQGSPRILTRIAQINALNLAEQGNFTESRYEAERFQQLAAETGDPLRIWHAQGLRTMFVLNDGDFETADALALNSMQFADLHDMAHGAASYIGLRVFSYDCQDRLGELKAELDPFRADLSSLHLGRTSLVLCDEAAGDADIADEVNALMVEALARGTQTFSLLSMLLLARFLPTHAPQLIAETQTLLERFGDNPILAGFGAGSFGPTSRYVAQITADINDKNELIGRSIAAADQQGPRLWRVRCRLDAADLGDARALSEAADIAAGSGLAAVVAQRAERLGQP